jgi:hypothetical protein
MKKKILFLFVLLATSLAVLARVKFNGLVYGFDYGIYQPDGIDYSFKTLQIIGVDPIKASQDISNWYSNNSLKMKDVAPEDVLQGQLTYPESRLLFPLLSAPFVKLFGLQGMLVIPIMSFYALQLSIFFLGVKYNRMEIATILVFIFSVSPTILRWMVNDCSDALFVAIISLIPFILNLRNQNIQRFLLSIIILGATLTRFSLPVFLAIGIVMLIKKNYLSALFLIILSTVSNIPALTQASYMLLPQSEDGFWSKIAQLPIAAFEVGFIEIAQLAVLDRVLLLVIIVSIYFALTNRQKDSSMYFLAVFLGVWALGAVNGTLGVNFRYQLPVIIFSAWVLLDSLPRLFLIFDTHVKRKEAQN